MPYLCTGRLERARFRRNGLRAGTPSLEEMIMPRILIVDDDPMQRALISDTLMGAGHETIIASDGRAALETYRDTVVDLVVTDMVMPGLDGLELLKALKEEDPEIPIIAVSGISADKLNKSARFGAQAILIKPLDPEELIREVETALSGEEPELTSFL
jgi:CheY-like chemotaxis protein